MLFGINGWILRVILIWFKRIEFLLMEKKFNLEMEFNWKNYWRLEKINVFYSINFIIVFGSL